MIITDVITGDTASGVSLLTLTRSDTGAPPGGVSLPLAYVSGGGGAWSATFADPAEAPPYYSYTFQIAWPDGTTSGPYSATVPTSTAPGDLPASMLANATGPKSVTVDGVNTTQHDLAGQIEMDKYLASKAAAASSPMAGVRRVRNVPPGAAGLDCDDRWGWRV